MPVYQKNRRELKNFRRYQYRKKPWLSWNGKMFWQTTIAGCTAIVIIILWICFGLAGYWLETVYQVWCIAFPAVPVHSNRQVLSHTCRLLIFSRIELNQDCWLINDVPVRFDLKPNFDLTDVRDRGNLILLQR